MNNSKIRDKLNEKGMRYYQMDQLLGISEATRVRMLRNELPEAEQDRICRLIDEYAERGGADHGATSNNC